MVVFVLPIVFSLKLRSSQMSWLEKAFGLLCVLTGLVGGAVGSYEALTDIVKKLQSGAHE